MKEKNGINKPIIRFERSPTGIPQWFVYTNKRAKNWIFWSLDLPYLVKYLAHYRRASQ